MLPVILSRSRSPSHRMRSLSPRKSHLRDRRDRKRVRLVVTGGKAEGSMPPFRQAIRLEEVKHGRATDENDSEQFLKWVVFTSSTLSNCPTVGVLH